MLTIVFAKKVSGANTISLPLTAPIVKEETPQPIANGQGSHGVIRYLQNETRQTLREPLHGFAPPLVYVYESVKQIPVFVVTPGAIEERARTIRQQSFVNYHLPLDLDNIAIGDITHVKKGFKLLSDTLSNERYDAPYFQPLDFDIPRIKMELAENQWFRRVKRERDIGVIMHGDRIEDDAIYNSLNADSEENDVGVIFQGPGAQLKIKLVTQGRIQFLNFRPEHVLSGHPEMGSIWPHVLDVIQFFTRYRR